MGSSTVALQDIVDSVAVMADVSPQANPTGYDTASILSAANDTMSELIARNLNWKWNSFNATPFLTNSWQQDYPQLNLANIGWIEEAWWLDVNNSQRPLPNGPMQAAKDLPIAQVNNTGYQASYPNKIAWMYNRQLQYGDWPGAGVLYSPLLSPNVQQNPPTAIIDANGNLLLLTTFGTTGATAPKAAAGSKEGTTVEDNTCVWTVLDPLGQGFRIDVLAPPTGPVYKIVAKCQAKARIFTGLTNTIDPVPDDAAHHFRRGFKAQCYAYASDAKTRAQYPQMRAEWIQSMGDAEAAADREPEAAMILPATQIVTPMWGMMRNPRDPGRPV
jgi:hypothetical protein